MALVDAFDHKLAKDARSAPPQHPWRGSASPAEDRLTRDSTEIDPTPGC